MYSISGHTVRQYLQVLTILILPLCRVIFAIEVNASGTDVATLPRGLLDNYALAWFRDNNETSYSLLFWDRFAVTVVSSPSTNHSKQPFRERIQQNLVIKPVNTPEVVAPAGVEFVRYEMLNSGYALAVCELNRIYEGLTPVLMPFEQGIESFGQWFNASAPQPALSAVVNRHSHNLLMIPLTFDPFAYKDMSGVITAEHDGSTLQAATALNEQILPGMSCLGQADNDQELMFLGIKPDRQVYQYNTTDGDPVDPLLQISFLPLEKVIHLVATTAGISQSQANRWRFSSDGSIGALALSSNDILSLFDLETVDHTGGYLCQVECSAGTAPPGQKVCQTRRGQYSSFYVLEGRLVEWVFVQDGQLPGHVRYADADSTCTNASHPICFVAVAETAGFGDIDENKGCNIGNGRGNYFHYYVPVVVSDGGATIAPEEPTLPGINDTNATSEYSGSPTVIVVTNPGFSEPSPFPVTNSSNGTIGPSVHQQAGNSTGNSLIVMAILLPTGIISLIVFAITGIYYLFRKSPRPPSTDLYHRLLEEESPSSDSSLSPTPSYSDSSTPQLRDICQLRCSRGATGSDLIIRPGTENLLPVQPYNSHRQENQRQTIEVEVEIEAGHIEDMPEDMPDESVEPQGITLTPPEERSVNHRPDVPKSVVSEDD